MTPQVRVPRVYACFDATGSKNPAATDLKYYFLLRAWERRGALARSFVDVHRTAARPGSSTALPRELLHRLRKSDVLLLIVTERTAASSGWLRWEIEFAARRCRLPIVCAYPSGVPPGDARTRLWPEVLQRLVLDAKACTLHVPFRPSALRQAFVEATSRHTDVRPMQEGPVACEPGPTERGRDVGRDASAVLSPAPA